MLLSVGIKNAILVLLIILIAHFLIKSVLVDKNPKILQEFVTDPIKPDTSSIPYPFQNTKQDNICNNETQKNYQRDEQTRNELLEFVYGDDDKELNTYFQNDLVSRDVKDLEQKIATQGKTCLKPDDSRLPLSTTCDDKIQTLDFKPNNMPVKADCDLLQNKRDFMILKEYQDDNVMNSGLLYGGTLLANDGANLTYSSV